MKNKFFMSICWLAMLAGFTACSDWNTPPVDYTDNMKVYLVPARYGARTLNLSGVCDTTIVISGVRYGGTQTPVGEITATLALWDNHPSIVAAYNAANGTEYKTLPAGVATLLGTKVTIPADGFASPMFSIRIINDNELLEAGAYLLPVQVTDVEGALPINKEYSTGYVIINYRKLDPNLEVWEHNSFLKLHTHTEGQGIPIVIIGDGFGYEDNVKGGKWETVSRELADKFLENPIIRDFKNYFDIYMIVVESEVSGIEPGNLAKSGFFNSGVNPDFGAANVFASHDGLHGCMDRSFIFVGNGMIGGYANYGNADGMGWGIYSTAEGISGYWMAHEFIGHGFAGLADEYSGSFSYGGVAGLQGLHSNGIGLNCSITNDPQQVPWAQFIGREGYDEVGTYEGGWGEDTDIWRPEEWSIMLDNRNGSEGDEALYYNAQSRWIIYKAIHDRAEMPYSFDSFLEYDKPYNVK
jgi:hypothetical protein